MHISALIFPSYSIYVGISFSHDSHHAWDIPVQWRLRFKITVCHTEENYLKHVTLLNRFKIVFLLNRYMFKRNLS